MNTSKLDHEQIKAMAKVAGDWWVSQLSPVPGSDIGDSNDSGAMLIALRILAAGTVDSSDAARFGMNIYDHVKAELSKDNGWSWLDMGVDYHPEGILRDALDGFTPDQARAIASQLPLKTRMSIDVEHATISVKVGYGREWQKIYPVEDAS